MLPGFSKNLLGAVKTIETMVGSFQGKIKSVEKDLWREYQTLEGYLELRTKKIERLEAIVRNSIASGTLGGGEMQSRLARLEEAYRQLKVENHTLRTAAEVRARTAYAHTGDPNGMIVDNSSGGGSPSPSVPTGPKAKDRTSRIPKSGSRGSSLGRTSTMTRNSSTHRVNLAAEDLGLVDPEEQAHDPQPSHDHQMQQSQGSGASSATGSGNMVGGAMDSKWMLRLRDLEYKLKAEREGRLLDRGEAMKRINASESENLTLRENLEREKRRQGR